MIRDKQMQKKGREMGDETRKADEGGKRKVK